MIGGDQGGGVFQGRGHNHAVGGVTVKILQLTGFKSGGTFKRNVQQAVVQQLKTSDIELHIKAGSFPVAISNVFILDLV